MAASISSHSNSIGALLFLPLCVDLVALGLDTHSSLSCFPLKAFGNLEQP